jgi:hypothetical protein
VDLDYRTARRAFEREYFRNVLLATGGKVNKAATASGISKVTFIQRMREFEMNHMEFKIEAAKESAEEENAAVVVAGLADPQDPDNDHSLADRARRYLAKQYLEKAQACRKNREHEAERVLLWMAVDNLGI